MVFVVETSEGGNFALRRNSTLETVHFGTFSVAKEAAVTGTIGGHKPPGHNPSRGSEPPVSGKAGRNLHTVS